MSANSHTAADLCSHWPIDARSDRAGREAQLRRLQQRLDACRGQLAALPADLPLAAVGSEWPERLLTAAVAGGSTVLPLLWAQGTPGSTAPALLAGLLSAAGATLLAERARRMALGEVLPAEQVPALPATPWWLALALGSAILVWVISPAVAWPVKLELAACSALGTGAAAWWSADRWQRHAAARRRQAERADRRQVLQAELDQWQFQFDDWLRRPCWPSLADVPAQDPFGAGGVLVEEVRA